MMEKSNEKKRPGRGKRDIPSSVLIRALSAFFRHNSLGEPKVGGGGGKGPHQKNERQSKREQKNHEPPWKWDHRGGIVCTDRQGQLLMREGEEPPFSCLASAGSHKNKQQFTNRKKAWTNYCTQKAC